MLTSKDFFSPNVYNGVTLANVALVTGSVQLPALTNGVAARLLGLIAENTSGSTAWIQVFDGYAAPSNAAVPLLSLKAATGVQISLDASAFNCVPVTQGIVIVLSSTGPTYTAIVSAAMSLTAFYIR